MRRPPSPAGRRARRRRSWWVPTLLVLGLAGVLGCTEPAGRALTGWQRTDVVPNTSLEAPAHLPAELPFRPVEPGTRLVFRAPLDGAMVWLRATAAPTSARDPVILLPKAYVVVAAYVDGRRVLDASDYREASGTPFYLVDLPRTDRPTDVTLWVASRYTQVGLPAAPRVGDRVELLRSLLVADASHLVLGIVFVFGALVTSILVIRSRERRAWVGMTAYLLGIGAWTLFHARTKHLWLDSGAFWFGAWWVGVPLTGLGVSYYLESIFGRGPLGLMRWTRISFTVATAGALISLALGDEGFRLTAPLVFVLGRGATLLGTLFVVGWLVHRAARRDAEARLLLGGFALTAVTLFHDVALSLKVGDGARVWTHFGYAAFGLALLLVLRRRLADVQQRMHQYARSLDRYVAERDALVRDLHDGIGGIVTNVRLIADKELAAEQPDAGPLRTISELAAEGLAELRMLIIGFDDLPETWRQVGAEIRRAGGTALEAHGVAYAFASSIADGAPPPALPLVVNALRVHREALTNVIKHSDARRVTVHLDVTDAAVVLTVADDGQAVGGRDGLNLGRGLASMKRRARELGGRLDIEREDGHCIRLTMPQPSGGDVE